LNDFLNKIVQCPLCGGKLKYDNNAYQCTNCSNRYPIVDGIPDFYPPDNIFSPRNIKIERKYENYGRRKSRSLSFQNLRRKKLTLDIIEGNTLLEIGAAEGWMTEEIAQRVKNVVSSDIALSYLKRAKSQGINVHFTRLDAHLLPFENGSFDSVVLTEVLEHVYSPYRVLEEVHRVLAPSGKLILSVPNNLTFSNIFQHFFNKNAPDKDAHLSFYDMFSITRLLGFAGFSVLKTKSVFVYLPLIKPLFYSNLVQEFLKYFLKNFGDKLILKAVKTESTLWEKL
jgi:SAM-dependent methyltransferase